MEKEEIKDLTNSNNEIKVQVDSGEEDDSMSFGDVCHNLFRHWKGMISILVVSLIVGVVYCTAIKKPEWQSYGKINISLNEEEKKYHDEHFDSSSFDYTVRLSRAYRNGVVDSSYVFQNLVDFLDKKVEPQWKDSDVGVKDSWKETYSVSELKKMVKFETPSNTPMIIITVTSKDVDLTEFLVNNILLTSKEYSQSNSYDNLFKDNVHIVEFASDPITDKPEKNKGIVKFAGIGIVLAILYAVIFEAVNPKICSVKEYENKTNTRVLAKIPSICVSDETESKGDKKDE